LNFDLIFATQKYNQKRFFYFFFDIRRIFMLKEAKKRYFKRLAGVGAFGH